MVTLNPRSLNGSKCKRMNRLDTEAASKSVCDVAALMLFLDGELALSQQSDLFSHLSGCSTCRRVMNGTLDFRRITREERFDVPSWSDDALYRRVDACRHQYIASSTKHRRASAWSLRTTVSVRSIVIGLTIVVITTVLFVSRTGERNTSRGSSFAEQVDLKGPSIGAGEAIYVFYPGLVIEGRRED